MYSPAAATDVASTQQYPQHQQTGGIRQRSAVQPQQDLVYQQPSASARRMRGRADASAAIAGEDGGGDDFSGYDSAPPSVAASVPVAASVSRRTTSRYTRNRATQPSRGRAAPASRAAQANAEDEYIDDMLQTASGPGNL